MKEVKEAKLNGEVLGISNKNALERKQAGLRHLPLESPSFAQSHQNLGVECLIQTEMFSVMVIVTLYWTCKQLWSSLHVQSGWISFKWTSSEIFQVP